MKHLVLLFLLLACSIGRSQTEAEIEKHKITISNNSSTDSIICYSYDNLIRYYSTSNIDSGKFYLQKLKDYSEKSKSSFSSYLFYSAKTSYLMLWNESPTSKKILSEFDKRIKYAQELKDKKFIILSYIGNASYCSYYNYISEADSLALLAQKLAIRYNNWKLLALSSNMLGNINSSNQKNIGKATQYYLFADSIYQDNNEISKKRAVNLIDLGNLFVGLNETSKAKNYYKQAEELNKTLQLEPLSNQLYLAFAEIDILNDNYPDAIKKIKKAKSYYQEIGKLSLASEKALMLSYCYYNNKQFTEAFEALDYAKKIKTKLGDSIGILITTITQADYNYYWGKDAKACFELASEAKELSIKLGSLIDLELSLGLLHLSSSKLGDYNAAYRYKLEHEKIKDSIRQLGEISQAREVEEKYQSEKKEQEIILLKSQNELAEQEKRSQRNYLIGGIILAVLASLFFFFLYRNRQKTNTKLKEIDTTKTRFFENISHEFRTPLTLIKLPLSRALKTKETLNEDQLNLMHNNTSRLQNLIEDLLSLSELDAGKMIVNKTQQDPLLQSKTLSSQFDSYATSKGIEYHKFIENNSITATYDKSVVDKVLTNLISNAIKYSDKGGKVQVSVSVHKQDLIMKVSDTGEGISTANQEKIFNRFYQVGEKDESKHGSGIGLALVKKVLELNEGSISVSSIENKGSTFTATLPIENRSNAIKNVEPETSALQEIIESKNLMEEIEISDKPILLIVEDNPELLNYISELFSEDFEIHRGINGIEGKEKALEFVPNIIISDWMMPKMNGIELLNEIKTNPATSHIPFLLLTAKADVEDKIKGYETGADAYFSKPFNYDELKAQITNLIAQRKALFEKFSDRTNENLDAPVKNSRDIAFWEELKAYIKSNLQHSENLSTEEVCKAFSMSRMQFHRKLMALTGKGLGALVKNQKMNYAAKLLKDPAMRVSDVCFEVGYSDNSAFARAFKQEIGLTPTQFKAQFKK